MKLPFPKLSSDTLLAPMAKITDPAFRTLCKQYGCGLTVTEMISANDLSRDEPLALQELQQLKLEPSPKCVQLYGLNMDNFIRATKIVQSSADILDLNFGCPYYKIVKQGCGSALLSRPGKIRQIVQNVVANSKIPVTCKVRLGLDQKSITILEVAKSCEQSGAALITVHARTTDQEYRGQANWKWIKKVKAVVSIPVCGNGDVSSVEDYLRMKKETNCDYVMIGRGAVGNPFIFKQINDYNKTGKYHKPTVEDRISALKEYLILADKFNLTVLEIKHQTMLFLERTFPDKLFKEQLEKIKERKEIDLLLEKIA